MNAGRRTTARTCCEHSIIQFDLEDFTLRYNSYRYSVHESCQFMPSLLVTKDLLNQGRLLRIRSVKPLRYVTQQQLWPCISARQSKITGGLLIRLFAFARCAAINPAARPVDSTWLVKMEAQLKMDSIYIALAAVALLAGFFDAIAGGGGLSLFPLYSS